MENGTTDIMERMSTAFKNARLHGHKPHRFILIDADVKAFEATCSILPSYNSSLKRNEFYGVEIFSRKIGNAPSFLGCDDGAMFYV